MVAGRHGDDAPGSRRPRVIGRAFSPRTGLLRPPGPSAQARIGRAVGALPELASAGCVAWMGLRRVRLLERARSGRVAWVA